MLSDRAGRIAPSATFAMKAKAEALKARGTKVYNFSTGEPDFAMPGISKEAVKEALAKDFTSYTAVSGVPKLKKAIVEKFKRENGLDYEASQVIAGSGAKQILYSIFQGLLNPGDEVIVPSPYWVSYSEQIRLAEGNPIFVETSHEFNLDPIAIEKAVSGKTKAILLNSPCNPTGAVIEKDVLEKIADIAVEKGIFVVSDEVYEHFLYDGARHTSIASLGEEIKEKTLTVNAVSKSYAMTGLRLGWVAGPKEIIKALTSFQGHSSGNPATLSQSAAIAALNSDQKSVAEMRKAFEKRRKMVVAGLSEIEGIECLSPKGAFYVFPYVNGFFKGSIGNSFDFCDAMLENAHVSLVPGGAFGRDECARLSYAASEEMLEKGLEAMKKLLENKR